MFWFLRRTGAANFLSSFNNNCNSNSSKIAYKNEKNTSERNNSWLRFRYGRLSVGADDSDELNNLNKKCDIDEVVVEVNSKRCEKTDSQYLDANGNPITDGGCECLAVEIDTQIKRTIDESNSNHYIDDNIMKKLQKIAISDEDYDESLTCNVCDRAFRCHRQLASHQQKKRHFGCGACDTIFPSLMILEHHKEEYEHWSDSEDYQQPCCRRNRREDYDFSDSEAFTSDAESEDLERLL